MTTNTVLSRTGRALRAMAAAGALLLVAACGGGEPAPATAQAAAGSQDRAQVLSSSSAQGGVAARTAPGNAAAGPQAAAPRVLAFFPTPKVHSADAYLFEQQPDGSGQLVRGAVRLSVRWVDDGRALRVIFDAPLLRARGEDIAPDGSFASFDDFETERVFRRTSGSLELGTVDTVESAHRVWTSGPLAGQVTVLTDASSPGQPMVARKPGLRLPMSAAEFPVGARWAGPTVTPFAPALPFDGFMPQDILRIVTATRAAGTWDTTRVSWRVRADALELVRTVAGVPRLSRWWRMAVDPASGSETWLLTVSEAGVVIQAFAAVVVRTDDSLALTPAGIVAEWTSSVATAGGEQFRISLFGDRTADARFVFPDGSIAPAWPEPGTWDLSRAGTRLLIQRVSPSLTRDRIWLPLARTGDWLWVHETLEFRRLDGTVVLQDRRVNGYRYAGPPVAPPREVPAAAAAAAASAAGGRGPGW